MIFDAVRIRLLEIGESVTAFPTDVTDREPRIPWSRATVANDLPELLDAVTRLLGPPVGQN